MIKSNNEINILKKVQVSDDKKYHTYEPTKETISISTVNKFEGILTQIKIGSRIIVVDTNDLLLSARNCQKTGTSMKSAESQIYERFGIEHSSNPYPECK